MKEQLNINRICPKCGATYTDRPALSREDNETLICPDCGIREALDGLGIVKDEREHILDTIHRHCIKVTD